MRSKSRLLVNQPNHNLFIELTIVDRVVNTQITVNPMLTEAKDQSAVAECIQYAQ